VYGLEINPWDRFRGRALPGVSGYLRVEPGADFSGTVQLNPVISIAVLAAVPHAAP